jgi:hypothetical protein
MNKNIYYINKRNRFKYGSIKDSKMIADFIRIYMKYSVPSPTILKKIASIHSNELKHSKRKNHYYETFFPAINKKLNNKILRINTNKINICKKIYNKTRNKIDLYKLKNEKIMPINRNKFVTYKQYKNFRNKSRKINNIIYFRYNNGYAKKYKYNIVSKNMLLNKTININNSAMNYLINKLKMIAYKKYPLKGLRIELNGPPKKARRTMTHIYNEFVDNYRLPGDMSLVTYKNDIKYWQSYGRAKRAAIGIKVWNNYHTDKENINSDMQIVKK